MRQLNQNAVSQTLLDPEAPAFACLVAALDLLPPELVFGEDGQPEDTQIIARELTLELGQPVPEANQSRINGLLYAASGDEFFTQLKHYQHMTSAITEGDAFASEDDDDVDLEDVFWAFYQLELVLGNAELDDLKGRMSPRIITWLEHLVDTQAAEEMLPLDDLAEAEDFFAQTLYLRIKDLGRTLAGMGVSEEDLASLDPQLLP